MTTKKDILDWIKSYYTAIDNNYTNGYKTALKDISYKLNKLPDDEWIRFEERMPAEEDYAADGYIQVANHKASNMFDKPYINQVKLNAASFENLIKDYPYWKRITLPAKQLPSKEEILKKTGLSEDELKTILK